MEFRGGSILVRAAIPWIEVPWKKMRTAESIYIYDVRSEWRVIPGECYLKRGVAVPTVGRQRRFPRE